MRANLQYGCVGAVSAHTAAEDKGNDMVESTMRSEEPRPSTYGAPHLHRYGGMRELTASGSGEKGEGQAQPNPQKRP